MANLFRCGSGAGDNVKCLERPYDPSHEYNTDDTTLYNGELYICLSDGVTGDWDDIKWRRVYLEELSGLNSNLYGCYSNRVIGLYNGATVELIKYKSIDEFSIIPFAWTSGGTGCTTYIDVIPSISDKIISFPEISAYAVRPGSAEKHLCQYFITHNEYNNRELIGSFDSSIQHSISIPSDVKDIKQIMIEVKRMKAVEGRNSADITPMIPYATNDEIVIPRHVACWSSNDNQYFCFEYNLYKLR